MTMKLLWPLSVLFVVLEGNSRNFPVVLDLLMKTASNLRSCQTPSHVSIVATKDRIFAQIVGPIFKKPMKILKTNNFHL